MPAYLPSFSLRHCFGWKRCLSCLLIFSACQRPDYTVEVSPLATLDAAQILRWRWQKLSKQWAAQPDQDLLPHSWSPATQQAVRVLPHVWTSGFFPACLWQAYAATGDTMWRRAAQSYLPRLAPQADNRRTHDLGFMIYLSHAPAWTLLGDRSALEVIERAASSLASRYDSRSGLIRSWETTGRWQQPTIIDNLMNLELLFAASRWLGDSSWYQMAHTHALRSAELHQRADGSHFHVVDIDPATGQVRAKGNRQGLHDHSVWSRGQAWAIYGFAMAYRETADTILLHAARRSAQYFLTQLPPDAIPYWDFALPNPEGEPRDASAGAIAAAGLLLLAEQESVDSLAQLWKMGSRDLLRSLAAPPMLTREARHHFTLQHATGNAKRNHEVDVPLIYADYYFTEALCRWEQLSEPRAIRQDWHRGRSRRPCDFEGFQATWCRRAGEGWPAESPEGVR